MQSAHFATVSASTKSPRLLAPTERVNSQHDEANQVDEALRRHLTQNRDVVGEQNVDEAEGRVLQLLALLRNHPDFWSAPRSGRRGFAARWTYRPPDCRADTSPCTARTRRRGCTCPLRLTPRPHVHSASCSSPAAADARSGTASQVPWSVSHTAGSGLRSRCGS